MKNWRKNMAKKKKIKNAIIWRESVYNNDFVCSCGKVLFENNQLPGDLLYDNFEDLIVCPNCRKVVARVTTEEDAIKFGAFRGETA